MLMLMLAVAVWLLLVGVQVLPGIPVVLVRVEQQLLKLGQAVAEEQVVEGIKAGHPQFG
jgi:hypothetical protein